MRLPKPMDFSGLANAAGIVGGATPPAKASYLWAADAWPVNAAITPYCGCAHLFRGGETGLETRNLRISVAPASVHARYHVAIGMTAAAGTAHDVQASTTQGGIGANDLTTIGVWQAHPRTFDPAAVAQSFAILSGDWKEDAPATSIDRLLELEELAHPKVEPASVSYVCGFSAVVCEQTADLETL